MDLPSDEESAGWWDYADAVIDAVGYRRDLVVVGHSLGASLRRWSVPASPLAILRAAQLERRRGRRGRVMKDNGYLPTLESAGTNGRQSPCAVQRDEVLGWQSAGGFWRCRQV